MLTVSKAYQFSFRSIGTSLNSSKSLLTSISLELFKTDFENWTYFSPIFMVNAVLFCPTTPAQVYTRNLFCQIFVVTNEWDIWVNYIYLGNKIYWALIPVPVVQALYSMCVGRWSVCGISSRLFELNEYSTIKRTINSSINYVLWINELVTHLSTDA